MKKRILGLFFTLAIVCGIAVTAFGADASGTYRGKTLIAVNTDFGTDTAVSGSVTTNSSSAENSIFSAEETYTQVSDGNIIVGTCELFDSLELIGPAPAMLLSEQVSPAAEYKPGDTKSIAGKCDDAHAVECLYIGTYCTVWGATEDDASI